MECIIRLWWLALVTERAVPISFLMWPDPQEMELRVPTRIKPLPVMRFFPVLYFVFHWRIMDSQAAWRVTIFLRTTPLQLMPGWHLPTTMSTTTHPIRWAALRWMESKFTPLIIIPSFSLQLMPRLPRLASMLGVEWDCIIMPMGMVLLEMELTFIISKIMKAIPTPQLLALRWMGLPYMENMNPTILRWMDHRSRLMNMAVTTTTVMVITTMLLQAM